jgi:hypothetical protein
MAGCSSKGRSGSIPRPPEHTIVQERVASKLVRAETADVGEEDWEFCPINGTIEAFLALPLKMPAAQAASSGSAAATAGPTLSSQISLQYG